MTKYTEEVERIFRTIENPFPGRLIVDVIEYPGGTLSLRVYQPNIEQLNQTEKVQAATYLYILRDSIRQVTNCEIEGVQHAPPHSQVVRAARESVLRRRGEMGEGLD